MGAFDGARTHDLHITSHKCNPLRHAAPYWFADCNSIHKVVKRFSNYYFNKLSNSQQHINGQNIPIFSLFNSTIEIQKSYNNHFQG